MNNNGVDTLAGVLKGSKTPSSYIKDNINQCNYRTSKDETYILVNPNKNPKGEKLINQYSYFLYQMDYILEEMGADTEDFGLVRCDFCFNSTDKSSFEAYKKLHRLILSCLAKAYKYENCYVSCDLWDFERLSIAIKKDDSEAENYNKCLQSKGKDESANRLELRSKRLRDTGNYKDVIPYQFLIKWFERLDNAIEYFDDVQTEYNNHLEKLYRADIAKPPKERDYLSLSAFLVQYRECIYTRHQMIDLLTRLKDLGQYENPTSKADRFKDQHKIEYFTQRDLKYIVSVLKRKAEEYFER
jgi:hypothetical protein